MEPAAAAEGSAKPEEEAAPAVKKDTKLSLQFGPPKAGLEKNPAQWVLLGFLWFFVVIFNFLYICPEERVFRVFFQFQAYFSLSLIKLFLLIYASALDFISCLNILN